MNSKILLVDDDINVLNGFKRQLRNYAEIDIETSQSAKAALGKIDEKGPYAIVISDMRMPGMDGIEFLSEVKKKTPDTVRIMLTGNIDQETAVQAINEGSIFRFINKPCTTEMLEKAIADGIIQHRLMTAEKELLQKTLSGSIKVLTDILSMADPAGFGRGMNLRDPVRSICEKLELENAWELEFAAMLSNIGNISIPSITTLKIEKGHSLSEEEQSIINRVPEVGSNLLKNIPRLTNVARIVLLQNKCFDGTGFPEDKLSGTDIPIGARILKATKDFMRLRAEGKENLEAMEEMLGRTGQYDPDIIKAISDLYCKTEEHDLAVDELGEPQIVEVEATDLKIGHKLVNDVRTNDNVLLALGGTTVTEVYRERIVNYAELMGLKEPIKIIVNKQLIKDS